MAPDPQFAANLRAFRARRHLTLGQLSARTGLSPATLSRFENDLKGPTPEQVHTLASALGVGVSDLVQQHTAAIGLATAAA